MKNNLIGLLVALIFVAGCAIRQYSIVPLKQAPPNKNYVVSIKAVQLTRNDLYNGMNISIINKTEKPIEIVWDKTFYLDHGKTKGGLLLEGEDYKDMHNSKPNDIVMAKSTYNKVVSPLNLVKGCRVSALGSFLGGYNYGPKLQCLHEGFRDGENGIYLTLLVNGEEKDEILTFNVALNR
jgi:hypothetical protein